MPLGQASLDRRSRVLILQDAAAMAKRNKWIISQAIGLLDESLALDVLGQWGKLHPQSDAEHAAQVLRGIKKWHDRDLGPAGLKGLYFLARSLLTPAEIALVEGAELWIATKRMQRKRLRGSDNPVDSGQRNIEFLWHGVRLRATIKRGACHPGVRRIYYGVLAASLHTVFQSKREAVRHWLMYQPKQIGSYRLYRAWKPAIGPYRAYQPNGSTLTWRVTDAVNNRTVYDLRDRKTFAAAIRLDRVRLRQLKAALPDPKAPDTLGWRVWDAKDKILRSPHQGAPWYTPELRTEKWSHSAAVRGTAGIHAARMPYDWKRAHIRHHEELSTFLRMTSASCGVQYIVGACERFGKYVLGTEACRDCRDPQVAGPEHGDRPGTRTGIPRCGGLL